ncbi:helix-turn-helix domain-containing protein [Aquimarina agarilytica]|uniref:helix-turn-helix domain-containing protein n=1 Tax=Aquimarina agarilytica TaxID=1087449 RepID=UPI000287B1C8|nr:helix-turn-helix transcriptional regulator [Aquimarina agarilytica]
MINNQEFTIRLQQILTHYRLSASAFAEKMGVGRSSISHIISGRNKPSLEFVLHILENFSEVTFEWLMYGKGNFPKSNETTTHLFSEKKITPEISTTENKPLKNNSKDLFSNTPAIPEQDKSQTNESNSISDTTDVERVIIFYKNGKFKEYKN